MTRKRCFFSVAGIALLTVLVFSGCGNRAVSDARFKSNSNVSARSDEETETPVKNTETDENVDEEYEETTEPTEDGDGSFRELSKEELSNLTDFVRQVDVYGFLLSEYMEPTEASLGEVFYYGAGISELASLEETDAYLKASGKEEIFTTCVKLDSQKVENIIQQRLGCSLEEMDTAGLGTYLPEYKAYFSEEADINYIKFTAVQGLNTGQMYEVIFKAEDNPGVPFSEVRTLLKKTDSGYQFLANYDETEAGQKDHTSVKVESAESAWEYLKNEKFAWCDMEEFRYDEQGELQIVVQKGEQPFGDSEIDRPFEMIVFLEGETSDSYQFGCHKIFYDGEDVFATQTQGWYWVNKKTGAVSQ